MGEIDQAIQLLKAADADLSADAVISLSYQVSSAVACLHQVGSQGNALGIAETLGSVEVQLQQIAATIGNQKMEIQSMVLWLQRLGGS
jgi:hypothetical protein